jgi:aspartate racemase
MKVLGMIGGTGPESTVEYYRRLIAAYHARVSESGAPPVIINSVDNKDLVKWFTAHDLAPVYQFSRGGDRTARNARALISR